MSETQSKRPKGTAFRQQNLKAWRPILTPKLVIALFLGVGVVFVPIGVAVIYTSDQIIEVTSADYSEECKDGTVDKNPCTISITVPKNMKPPVYMYYKLTNYYQNHRRYVKSRSDPQLRGKTTTIKSLNSTCEHRVVDYSEGNGYTNDSQAMINPCGLIAWSYFNDSFSLTNITGAQLPLTERGIAWKSDVEMKFNNSADGTSGQNSPAFKRERSQTCDDLASLYDAAAVAACKSHSIPEAGWCYPGSGFCVEDEHFIVWMRTAGLPTFRKLYAILNEELEAGEYNVTISNGILDTATGLYMNPTTNLQQTNLYPVKAFSGTKSIVLSTASWIGGRNDFLGWAYLVVGVVMIVMALAFALKMYMCPRELGNASYVPHDK